jgi:hypothetical protein
MPITPSILICMITLFSTCKDFPESRYSEFLLSWSKHTLTTANYNSWFSVKMCGIASYSISITGLV